MLTTSCSVVFLEECELSKQLHPKENDLVFLVPERLKGGKRNTEEKSVHASRDYHCAYVQKFRRTSVSKYLTGRGRQVPAASSFQFLSSPFPLGVCSAGDPWTTGLNCTGPFIRGFF